MVWLALKEMVSDREIACDTAVLSLLGENASVDYGTALLHFAAHLSHLTFGQTAGIGGSRKEIRKRISFIASYRRESGDKRIKSRMLYLLTAALVLCTTPSVSALACASDRYTEALPRTDQEDLSEYLDSLTAVSSCMTLQKTGILYPTRRTHARGYPRTLPTRSTAP